MKRVPPASQPALSVNQSVATPNGPSEQAPLLAQVGEIVLNSGTYFLADAAARGLNLVLVLAYTQVLMPSDYAILAVATSVTLLLVPVLGLSISAALSRLYFEATTEADQRKLYATALAFLLVVPTFALLAIEVVGRLGWLDVFGAVPYDPYLRLAVLAAYVSLFVDLPVAIYIARRQARRVAGLTFMNAGLLVGLSLLLVVGFGQGVRGVLLAAVLAGGAMAVVALALTAHAIRVVTRPSKALLASMLLFSVPLVPHAAAQWVLQVSDRLVLSHYVSSVELGLYYVGYSVGATAAFVVFAANKAMSPTITAELKNPDRASRVPRLGTYWFAGLVVGCLAVALYGPDAVKILAPNEFLAAADIVPIIALGSALYGVYTIVSSSVWFSMRTGWVPVLTGLAAALNVGLNLVFVPRFGIEAAAWNTVAGFAALAAFQGLLAARRHPIAWEYRRWAVLTGVGLGAYFAVQVSAPGLSVVRFLLSALAIIVVFPMALTAAGFWSSDERRWLRHRLFRQAV